MDPFQLNLEVKATVDCTFQKRAERVVEMQEDIFAKGLFTEYTPNSTTSNRVNLCPERFEFFRSWWHYPESEVLQK